MSAPLRARLVAFYQRHNPENVHKVDTILGAWGHNEAELWRQMAAKYGQRAVDEAQRAPPPPSTGFSAAPVLQPLPFSPAGFAGQVPPPAPPRRPNPSRFAAPPVPGRGFGPAPPAPGFASNSSNGHSSLDNCSGGEQQDVVGATIRRPAGAH